VEIPCTEKSAKSKTSNSAGIPYRSHQNLSGQVEGGARTKASARVRPTPEGPRAGSGVLGLVQLET